MTKTSKEHAMRSGARWLTLLTLLAAGAAFADLPVPLLTYSGQLLDPAGRPVTSGKLLHFKLYDVAENGTAIFSQDVTIAPDSDGNFTVVLGNVSPALDPRAFNKPLWLGMQVDTDIVEMKPRLQLTSAPYALTADWTTLSSVPSGFADGTDDGLVSVSTDSSLTGGGTAAGPLGVNLNVVQSRLSTACAPGLYARGFAGDGTPVCEVDKTTQLADGGTMSLVSDVLATAPLQSTGGATPRLSIGACALGQLLKFDGGWRCAPDLNSGGTVTAVTAGAGLTGGTITGTGTLGLASTVQNWATQPSCAAGQYLRSVTAAGAPTCTSAVTSIIAGTGLTGGTITGAGTIGLAATVQSWATQPTCAAGSYLRAVSLAGAPTCAAGVASVTATLPLSSSGGATPNLTLANPLPVANGGTGSATKSWVDLTTNQSIAGNKNFTGNVGIGTATPVTDLDITQAATPGARVNWTSATSYGRFQFAENGTLTGQVAQVGTAFGTAARRGALEIQNLTTSGPMTLWTNNLERVRIESGGRVGIGTDTPGAQLHVARDTDGGSMIALFENVHSQATNFSSGIGVTDDGARKIELDLFGATSTTFPSHAGFGAVITNNTPGLMLAATNPAGMIRFFPAGLTNERVRITSAGNVGIGTTTPATRLDLGGACMTGSSCSDASLKENIEPLREKVLDRVMQLEPSTFTWKARADGKKIIGLIAQQVEKVFPEVVTTPDDGSHKGLECTGLNAITLQAVKEQQLQLRQQQQQIEELRRELAALRARR